MSAVVLDASATNAQVPAIYAETVFCGLGGVIAATDPTVGVKFSRQYGALGEVSELLCAVRKDLGLPPAAQAGGTLDCAGITFQGGIIANTFAAAPLAPQLAGTRVMGISNLNAGQSVITASGVNAYGGTSQSVIFVSRYYAGGVLPSPFIPPAIADIGPLQVCNQTAGGFVVNSLLASTGLINAADNSHFFWMIVNPSWTA